MSTTIWSGLNAGIVRYDLTYDASRPDPYGTQVNITFHLHVYRRSSSTHFGYQIRWDSMWCNGTNWAGWLVKENSPNTFDFWTDCNCTVYTSNDWIGGVRLIMTSPNNSPSGWYDTGNDINISVPAKQIPRYWNDINAYYPDGSTQGGLIFDLKTSDGSQWWNLTNEPDGFTKLAGTTATVSNIRSNVTGAHYSGNNITGNAASSFTWTFNTANWVTEIYTAWNVRTMTIRKGTGIADITNPAWGWTGNYKQGNATYGTQFTVNVSLLTGYHWGNWSGTFSTTSQEYTFTVEDKDYDITANGIANTYTVKYDGNGNTGGSTASSSHTYNTSKALTSNGFTKIGYSFNGWNTKADGSGTSYSDEASVKNLTSTNGATVTLYAQWSLRAPYNLFFDAYPKRDKIKIEAGCTGANITNVTVYYRANSTGDYSSLNLGTSFEGTISSLQPNTNYQIYVKVTNAAGSANSVADEFKTGAYLPANPKITLSNIQPFSVSTTVSATAETNAANSNYKVYYTKKISKDTSDMAVMSLSDGSLWARVFYHNCKEGADLFTSLAQIKSVNTDTKYSKLSSLSNYKFSDGKYEFLLRYPNLSATQYNRWKQTNSPCDEFITTTTAGDGTATGYTAVHIDWTGLYWGGLTRQNSNANTITDTYLSGSVGHGNWFYALGATSSWGIGIPAYLSGQNYANWGSVELWVRINDAAVTTIDLGTSTTKVITGLEEETEYSMWMSVTNVGGTNYSSITNFTTPVDQAKVYIKGNAIYGDINGDGVVDMSDWELMNEFINEVKTPTSLQILVGDVNQDGKINIKDSNALHSHLTGATPSSIIGTPIPNTEVWYMGKLWIKQNGEWKKVKRIYSKQNGEWQLGKNL